jgi:hypothetical protein
MESITCKNCSNVFEENYCNKCGQRAIENQRLNSKDALLDFLNTTLLFDKRLLFTFRNLFINPGKVGAAYIKGQRNKFTKPSRYFIVIVAIFAILNLLFKPSEVVELFSTVDFFFLSEQMNHSFAVWNFRFDVNHLFTSSLGFILILTFILFFIFRKYNHSYIELLAVNSYYFSTATLLMISLMTLFKLFSPESFSLNVAIFIFFIYTFWSYYCFFNKEPKTSFFIKMVIISTLLIFIRVSITLLFCVFYPIAMDVLK